MDRDTTKILIYAAANTLNKAMEVGWNAGMNAAREARNKAAFAGQAIGVVGSYEDFLINDGGSKENTVILSLNPNNKKGDAIEILNAKVDITKNNKIIPTSLIQRTGTVKERIQEEDYAVVIKGSLFLEEEKFPHAELALLNKILSEAKSIYVASVYTRIFGIDKLVFKKATFNQSTWNYFNVMPFTIDFESDMDYDFLLNE